MSPFPNAIDLQHRIRRACLDEDGQPLVFVVGSGMSTSLPSSSEMVDLFRMPIAGDPEDEADFSAAVDEAEGGEKYQLAARFLLERAGMNVLNRVIRGAVLRARSPRLSLEVAREYVRDESRLKDLEDDTSGWLVPQGIRGLGRILASVPPERRGPILTTNFDPLIEVSLRLAGLNAFPVFVDSDGSANVPELPSGFVAVVHLHGGWRAGDTLHTGTQLTRDRPRLLASLRQIMSNCTCVIAGYGGWDDVLTGSIRQLVTEGGERELEVLWACYRAEPDLGVLTGTELPGRIQPYVGVDANVLFPAVNEAIARRMPSGPARPVVTPRRERSVAGLTRIDDTLIAVNEAVELDPNRALTFFDGREATWVDIVSRRAPVLSLATSIIVDLTTGWADRRPLLVLEGPTGEGKSTILKQLAHELARRDGYEVLLWENASTVDIGEIVALSETSRRIVLVVDDADLRAKSLSDLATRLEGRSDIRIVAAARDTDWDRSVQREGLRLSLTGVMETRVVSGITEQDAELLVEAWAELGSRGLGRLAMISDNGARARELYRTSVGNQGSALLGAMLETRYGVDFRTHISELLERLGRMPLPGGATVRDAYFLICLISQLRLPPLRIDQLGAALQLSEEETLSLVVRRLGREAAATRHGDTVIVRHPRIASTASEMMIDFGVVTTELLRRLIVGVFAARSGRNLRDEDVKLVYCSQYIDDEQLAIAAAMAAVEADPRQLRLRVNLAGQLRRFARSHEAMEACEEAWEIRGQAGDQRLAGRRLLREWSRNSGLSGNWHDSAALNACGIVDFHEFGPVGRDDLSRALSGLAFALNQIDGDVDVEVIRCLAEDAMELAEHVEVRHQARTTLDNLPLGGRERSADTESARWERRRQGLYLAFGLSDLAPVKTIRRDSRQLGSMQNLLR